MTERPRSVDGGIDAVAVPGMTGRMWLAGKHAVAADPEAAMARVGASMVICLCQAHELDDRFPGYTAWLREPPHEGAARWFPTPDLGVRSLADTVALVDEVLVEVGAGNDVLIHCGAGIGRAGTLACMVLMAAGSELATAVRVIAANRPMGGPEAGQQSDMLHEFGRHLGR